jgi:sugar lactone lactonase YvrE
MAFASATATVTGLEPVRVAGGARFTLRGTGFPIPDAPLDAIKVGGRAAHVVFAARDRLVIEAPPGLEGGQTPVELAFLPGLTAYVEAGVPVATGFHQVDSPVFDRAGNLYVTYSGSRGQEAPVSIFRVPPRGGREPFVSGIVNATSMAVSPEGDLYVSSRFDGTVSRITDDGRHEVVASDLGRACGLAFAPDGSLFVGDRSGTIFHLDLKGGSSTFASLAPSIAAFHLAMGPDQALYVTAPTLASRDHVYRIEASGRVEPLDIEFGRPQGLAFDPTGMLHIVEALAGASGVYRLRQGAAPELLVAGQALVGVAFAAGQMVVCSNDTAYRF